MVITGGQFLYRCTTGMVDKNAHGCIMADGMGLGKTVREAVFIVWSTWKLTLVASMHLIDVDATQAIARSWEEHHSKMHYCVPIKFSWQLGQRAW